MTLTEAILYYSAMVVSTTQNRGDTYLHFVDWWLQLAMKNDKPSNSNGVSCIYLQAHSLTLVVPNYNISRRRFWMWRIRALQLIISNSHGEYNSMSEMTPFVWVMLMTVVEGTPSLLDKLELRLCTETRMMFRWEQAWEEVLVRSGMRQGTVLVFDT